MGATGAEQSAERAVDVSRGGSFLICSIRMKCLTMGYVVKLYGWRGISGMCEMTWHHQIVRIVWVGELTLASVRRCCNKKVRKKYLIYRK